MLKFYCWFIGSHEQREQRILSSVVLYILTVIAKYGVVFVFIDVCTVAVFYYSLQMLFFKQQMISCLKEFDLRHSEPDHLFWQGSGPAVLVNLPSYPPSTHAHMYCLIDNPRHLIAFTISWQLSCKGDFEFKAQKSVSQRRLDSIIA